MNPTVSVVMPAYNAAAYIGAAIRSVLAQSHKDWELIVVDDCSTDDSASIVADFARDDDRIRLIRLERNRGAPAGPRNLAIQAARGEWIAFLDADDLWHPEKLRWQLQALDKMAAKFCSTRNINFVDERALKLSDANAAGIESIGFRKQLINFRTPTSSVVASRALLLRHQFNEDLRYKAREDLDCWLHCIEEAGGSIKLRAPLMGYRIVAGQISGSKWQMFRRHLFVLRRYRRKSGKGLGVGALLFTLSHFTLALGHRWFRNGI
jgi:teichuronic acid biosynthesis glycosyltransferase TuaG